MSDDFISRKALLELANQEGAYGYVDAEQIAKQPTAYDVDEVCEKLGEMQIIANTYNERVYVMAIEKAIEIVKDSERRWHRRCSQMMNIDCY